MPKSEGVYNRKFLNVHHFFDFVIKFPEPLADRLLEDAIDLTERLQIETVGQALAGLPLRDRLRRDADAIRDRLLRQSELFSVFPELRPEDFKVKHIHTILPALSRYFEPVRNNIITRHSSTCNSMYVDSMICY